MLGVVEAVALLNRKGYFHRDIKPNNIFVADDGHWILGDLGIVLDTDNTEMLDSQGLTALLNALDQARKQGGDIKIATTNSVNRKILEITRLDQQLDVFESVIDAVKSFRA